MRKITMFLALFLSFFIFTGNFAFAYSETKCQGENRKAAIIAAKHKFGNDWPAYYMKYYKALPSCDDENNKQDGSSAKESAPVITPKNLSSTIGKSAEITNKEMCDNVSKRAIAAKGVAAVLNDRNNVSFYYDEMTKQCDELQKAKERRGTFWSRLFSPSPYYRGYYSPGIGISISGGFGYGGYSSYGYGGYGPTRSHLIYHAGGGHHNGGHHGGHR